MATDSPSTLEKGISATDKDQTIAAEGSIIEKHRITDRVDDLSEVEASKGWFGVLVRYARLFRVEERGIERVREEDRIRQSPLDGFTMWASANFT